MPTPRQQAIVRAQQLLGSVKRNAATARVGVPETQVREYHAVLTQIKNDAGIDTAQFRIQDSDMQPEVTSFDSYKGEKVLSKEKYAPKQLVVDKINAVLKVLEAGLAAKS